MQHDHVLTMRHKHTEQIDRIATRSQNSQNKMHLRMATLQNVETFRMPPKRRGGEQGGAFDSRKEVNPPANTPGCAQQGALAHSIRSPPGP